MDSNKKKTEKKALLRSAAAPSAPSRERIFAVSASGKNLLSAASSIALC